MKQALGYSSILGALILAVTMPSQPLGAVDFLRGDSNWDGEVTFADTHLPLAQMFLGFENETAECILAWDTNGDGTLDISDAVRIFAYVVEDGPPPAAPFPEPGTPPEPIEGSELTCSAYGGGSPLEDADARLTVLDTTALGGETGLAFITVTATVSNPSAGYYLEIEHDPELIAGVGGGELLSGLGSGFRDLTPSAEADLGFSSTGDRDGVLHVAIMPVMVRCPGGKDFEGGCAYVPAGEDIALFELAVCLQPGTPAGDYPLTLRLGEFADNFSGRAVRPELVSGTLTVLADVEASECNANPPPPPPPPDVIFNLKDVSAAPGAEARMPFSIEANLPSQGFSFSVDFDEEILQATEVERLWSRASGTPFEFENYEFNNENRYPGHVSVEEGYIVGAAIISLADTEDVLPPEADVEVLSFHFQVAADTTADSTEVSFTDGALGEDGVPVKNELIAGGRTVTAATTSSFVLIPGVLNIVPDGVPFSRGDSNRDTFVDISDPLTTLGYLFLEGYSIDCPDAADANDSGRITIADATFTLEYMFLGTVQIPPPFPGPGIDPTEDALRCGPGVSRP